MTKEAIDILPLKIPAELKQFMNMMEESQRHFEERFEELILKPMREQELYLQSKTK